MAFSPLVDELVESLRCLPGVGQKTAQRMAFHLLERGRSGGTRLSEALSQAMSDGVLETSDAEGLKAFFACFDLVTLNS